MDYVKLFLEISATISTILGAFFVAIPRKIGLYFFIISTILWGIFGYLNKQYFFLFTNVILIGFDIYGIYRWGKKGIK